MKKEVLISIKGVQTVNGESDAVELVTTGSYYQKNGTYYIVYDESEATGYENCRTTLKIEPENRLTMLRFGDSPSQFVIEKGARHQCAYNTGYGPFMLGVMGEKFSSRLDDQGGEVDCTYSLDINATLASENQLSISVKSCEGDGPSC